MRRLYVGDFNSERFWQDSSYAVMPGVRDIKSENIVNSMDEMQFVFCKKDDLLMTRYDMNSSHVDYLRSIGFDFEHIQSNSKISDDEISVFKSYEGNEKKIDLSEFELSPFAIIPDVDCFCKKNMIANISIENRTIKKVNSKIYSTNLSNVLNIGYGSIAVNSTNELKSVVIKQLKKSPVIIKEEFGVSGKGSILVKDINFFERLISIFTLQERKGKKIRFIVEPYLDKLLDFSSQFFISKSGEFELLSINQVSNQGLRYDGTNSVTHETMNHLEKNEYFDIMKKVSSELYKEGYHGHVCVDSMILNDKKIIPVVEINARKSMSLMKRSLDKHFNKHSLISSLCTTKTVINNSISFENFLTKLSDMNLLYTKENKNGIVILSSNTVFINKKLNNLLTAGEQHLGTLYYSSVGKDVNALKENSVKINEFIKSIESI